MSHFCRKNESRRSLDWSFDCIFCNLSKTKSEPESKEIEINWVMCKETCEGEGLCDKCGYQGRCCSGASENESRC